MVLIKVKRFKNKLNIIHERNILPISFYIIITILTISQINRIIYHAKYQEEYALIEFKISGEFLRSILEPDDIIIARKQNYLFYSKTGIIQGIPGIDINQFYLGVQSADYVIICERIEVSRRPYLGILLNSSDPGIPAYMNNIFCYNASGMRIRIYEIV